MTKVVKLLSMANVAPASSVRSEMLTLMVGAVGLARTIPVMLKFAVMLP